MSILSVPRRVIKLKAEPRRWCATPRCEGYAQPHRRLCPACDAAAEAREKLDRLVKGGDAGLLTLAAHFLEAIEVDAELFRSSACRAIIDAGFDAAARHLFTAQAVREVRDPIIDRPPVDDEAFARMDAIPEFSF